MARWLSARLISTWKSTAALAGVLGLTAMAVTTATGVLSSDSVAAYADIYCKKVWSGKRAVRAEDWTGDQAALLDQAFDAGHYSLLPDMIVLRYRCESLTDWGVRPLHDAVNEVPESFL